jgi:hypothetical protein
MSEALVGGIATFLGVVVAGLTLAAQLKKQRTERVRQRAAIRDAVHAEVNRVREILIQQAVWLAKDSKDPLNWLPIQTQVWDGLAAQIGSLEAKVAGELTTFFGFVRWHNDVLTLRGGAYKDDPAGFLETYKTVFRSVAKNLPSRFHTDEYTEMLKSYASSKSDSNSS